MTGSRWATHVPGTWSGRQQARAARGAIDTGPGPVPSRLKQARALDQEGEDPVVQRGPWRGGTVGRGGGGPLGQEEAGTENEASFGSGSAHD